MDGNDILMLKVFIADLSQFTNAQNSVKRCTTIEPTEGLPYFPQPDLKLTKMFLLLLLLFVLLFQWGDGAFLNCLFWPQEAAKMYENLDKWEEAVDIYIAGGEWEKVRINTF